MCKKYKTLRYIFVALCILVSCAPQPVEAPDQPRSPSPMPTSIPTPTSDLVLTTVFFTDRDQYATGTPPFEVGVTRKVHSSSNLPEAVLQAFFDGPTPAELAQGLEAITSGFTGFSALVIEAGIARVYLTGECASNGATYTIAQPIIKNLLQFEDIRYVKIYDENAETEEPEGETNSIPFCLEP